MDFEKIKKIIHDNPTVAEFGSFGDGVDSNWISEAEKRLGKSFPPSYCWWLKNYGGGEINGDEVYSIYELDFDSVVGGDIVYINELGRKSGRIGPEKIVIQNTDYGEEYYFLVSESTPSGEYPIFENMSGKKYANNFLEFLEKKILE